MTCIIINVSTSSGMRELKSPTTEFAADTFTPLINSESSPQLKEAFLLRTVARGLAFGSGRAFFYSLMLNGQQSVCGSKEQLSAERHGRKKKKKKGAKVRVFKLRCPFSLEEFQKEGEREAQSNSER